MSENANTKERSAELARIAIAALEEKKAVDIRVIDISEVSVLADYFIIANGSNGPQIQALSTRSVRRWKEPAPSSNRLRDMILPAGSFWISVM